MADERKYGEEGGRENENKTFDDYKINNELLMN